MPAQRKHAALAAIAAAFGLLSSPGARAADEPGKAFVDQALTITEPRYLLSFTRYCTMESNNTANGHGQPATPSKLFDNLYYVGRTDVGAWVVKTSGGLVLIDTLYNAEDAKDVVEGGMRNLGLDPAQIKLVILTHFHPDHSGGMPYFRSKGIKVMVSEADWKPLGGVPGPDAVLRDGQVITVGDTPITIALTPGHTPGTITAIFPVFDKGQRHMAALTGGIGPRGGLDIHKVTLNSLEHLREVGAKQKVDVYIDPHEALIDSDAWGWIMNPASRKAGVNPLIVGQAKFQQFTRMVTACMNYRVAEYEKPPAAK